VISPWLQPEWKALAGRLAQKRIPHALLVCGPAGLGKRAFAAALSAALLCHDRREDGHACGACRACTLRAAGTHPDRVLATLEPNDEGLLRSEISIEQIRSLGSRLAMRPNAGDWQVAVVDPADRLNVFSSNALLKTLEEPAADTVLILVANQATRLPATIRSRCHRVEARFPSRDVALAWLQAQGAPAAAASESLALAAGNPGAALDLALGAGPAAWREVAGDLAAVARGTSSAMDVAARWARKPDEVKAARKVGDEPARDPRSDAPYPDEVRVALAAQLARLATMHRAGADPGLPAAADLSRLTVHVEIPKLAAWWDRANRTRDLLRAPLRADLLLLDLLREWQSLARPRETGVR
jgi:DNA polymerase-3 subunit delta'